MSKKRKNKKFINILLFLFVIILFISGSYQQLCFSDKNGSSNARARQKYYYPNIILITIDTLRADHLSCYGYKFKTSPHIDQLAKKSTLCTNVMAQVPLTLPSHATIFTGKSPLSHGIKNNANFILDESEITLAEILRSKGYHTAAFIGGFPLVSYFGLNQGFDYYDDQLNERQYQDENAELERNAKDVADSALSWLSKHEKNRFFIWIHFYDPHLPYTPPKEYEKGFESRYDAEISFVDAQIGKLMNFMEDFKLYPQTLIIITSDHGEGLGDHHEKDHGIFLYNSTLKIPLIIKPDLNRFSIRKIDTQIAAQDIMPTILDMIGIKSPEGLDGISVAQILKGHSDSRLTNQPPFYIESYYPFIKYKWSILRGIVWNGYKFIDAPKDELYNLAKDKNELHNVYQKSNEIVLKIEQFLRNFVENKESEIQFTEIDKGVLEKLKSLGYVGSNSPFEKKDFSSFPDPKTRILLLNKIDEAKKLLSKNQYKSAISLLKSVMQEDNTNPVIYNNLGIASLKLGESEKALYYFKIGLKHDPDNVYIHNNLGFLYRKQGKYSLSIREHQASIDNDPLFLGAIFNLSVAHYLDGNDVEAIKAIKKVLKEDPNFPEAKKMLKTYQKGSK